MIINKCTWAPLVPFAVYEYNDQLLEATWAPHNTWLLLVLDENAEYVAEAQGRLFALELQENGLFDQCFYVQIAAIWPSWHFIKGQAPIAIDPAKLELVATSRFELQTRWMFEDQAFEELMSEVEFEWKEGKQHETRR